MRRYPKRNFGHASEPAPTDQAGPPTPPTVVGEPLRGMDLINYVAHCLRIGCDAADVRKRLVEFGFTEANADKIIADTRDWVEKNPYAGQSTEAPPEAPVDGRP